MIIHYSRIFSSSVYHDSPLWVSAVQQMAQWDDERCLAHIDTIIENSGYICLTPAVCKEFERVLAAKDYAGFFSLFDALRYPVFSASLVKVMLDDVAFLGDLILQMQNQTVLRPRMTMAIMRERWMELMARNILKKGVTMGEPVEKAVTKPIDEPLRSQIVDYQKGMIQVMGAEEMFHWAIEVRLHLIRGNIVQYTPDLESVAYNRLRLFVLNTLPNLVDLNAMKTDANHLPYTLYLLCAYVHKEPSNIARMDELLKEVFAYIGSDTAPTCCNDELYHLLVPAAEAYAMCRNQDSKEMLALIDSRRVNTEGWRVTSHHKKLEDDDVDTDVISWPEHYMQREQQEIMTFRLAWHLLSIDKQFADAKAKDDYYEAISNRLFGRLASMDGNSFRVDSYGYHAVVALAYDQTCNAMPGAEEVFVSRLIDSIDCLFDLYIFLCDCKIQLKTVHKQVLRNRFDADWAGERKVYEILGLYKERELDEVEAGLKNLL